jgi:hypothetical protein
MSVFQDRSPKLEVIGMPEKGAISPIELMCALKRYIESGETEKAVAYEIGIHENTLHRWLSGESSPKGGKLALTAYFLRRVGYL